MMKALKAALVLPMIVGVSLMLSSAAHADPAPTPDPATNPPWSQPYADIPCGMSINPVPIPHLRFKQCP